MSHLLQSNPLLLLLFILMIGHVLSYVRIGGFGLGISSVLFVALAFGAWNPHFMLPDIVYMLGLSLFVYTMGLSSGPAFFRSFGLQGWRVNSAIVVILCSIFALAMILGHCFHWASPWIAGLYAGAMTNTPALAATLEYLHAQAAPEALQTAPVIAYSLAYPAGVLGMLAAVYAAKRWQKNMDKEAPAALECWTIEVTEQAVCQQPLGELRQRHPWNVSFARIQRDQSIQVATDQSQLRLGDVMSLVGTPADLAAILPVIGRRAELHLDFDRSAVDFRRIFVSNKSVLEKPIENLQLESRYGATITRIRRGDVDLIPQRRTVLEPGDRVRVVAPRDQMQALTAFLGDSYRQLSEFDVMTFASGLALGLLLGLIPCPLPWGGQFSLGFAGGPLLVGLCLGRLGRTGPFIWTLPYSANLTLRQLGLLLFLAGVGLRSGASFIGTLQEGGRALQLMGAGALLSFLAAAAGLFMGHRLLRLPFAALSGFLAGLQTQPAVLAYAVEQAKNDEPNVTYALVYPTAMIVKILLVQILPTLMP